MFQLLDKERLERTRDMMRGEQLHKLKFADAFRDTLSMMALLIDMTRSFASADEYRQIPDHCGSLPEFHRLNGKKGKKKAHRRP
jgi:hypothetical protein